MLKTANLKKSSRTNMFIALGVALGVSIVAYLLFATFAAGPIISIEPEAGIAAASKAKSIDDPTASGGKALQFAGVAPVPGEEDPTPPPSGDPGEVLMDGGFETGNTGSPYQYKHGDVSIVTSPVREGEYAARFSGSSGQRAQLDRPFTFVEGDEYYIGFSTFFPSDFESPPSWALFFQLHGPPYSSGSPPISLLMGEGDNQMKLVSHNPGSSGRKVHWTKPIVKNEWTDITMRVKFTESSSGFVELWVNGQPQTFSSSGSTRMTRSTMIDRYEIYPTLTAYMGSGSATVYHDALKVGTTYQSVQPK